MLIDFLANSVAVVSLLVFLGVFIVVFLAETSLLKMIAAIFKKRHKR